MRQEEINEISQAFLDAWKEFFGAPMLYIPFDSSTSNPHPIYNESRNKKYDEANAVEFYGTLKEREMQDVTAPTGKKIEKHYEITLVTQELIDKGVNYIDTNDIIRFTDRFGKVYDLEIYDDFQKVQLVDNKIFTKLKVKHYG